MQLPTVPCKSLSKAGQMKIFAKFWFWVRLVTIWFSDFRFWFSDFGFRSCGWGFVVFVSKHHLPSFEERLAGKLGQVHIYRFHFMISSEFANRKHISLIKNSLSQFTCRVRSTLYEWEQMFSLAQAFLQASLKSWVDGYLPNPFVDFVTVNFTCPSLPASVSWKLGKWNFLWNFGFGSWWCTIWILRCNLMSIQKLLDLFLVGFQVRLKTSLKRENEVL